MSKKPEHEYGTKVRLLRVMLLLLNSPYGYNKKGLATTFGVSDDTIANDFDAFRTAGMVLDIDRQNRYAFVGDKPYKQLKDLLHFTEEDQQLLMEAIDQVSPHSTRGEKLKKKLASLYDYHRLGHSYLRKPYLTKIDELEEAKKNKKQVILQDYHSTNSDVVSDRQVEPFHISASDDIVQAFDVHKKGLRYFRISRIARVRPLEESWQYASRHVVMPADPFRIVDANQKKVHIRLNVGAYNDLIERFPLCKAHTQLANETDVYDLLCDVNHQFIGITNFLLGNHAGVEILEPESLIDHLNEQIKKMSF